jgi:hypothetical protein
MWKRVCLLTLAAVSLAAATSEAANPRRIGGYNKQVAVAAYGRAVYPRYRYDFHIREFENLGIPHGDQGMGSANGLTRNPW